MLTIKLLKYDNKYAKGVADMWNDSAEQWGGLGSIATEESTINNEENSACLDLTLAKTNDEIIGYCKLSVDHHDEGALYIDLLNVRPDYHGKSIGKMLLLDSLQKTIDRGWRRLDLFTWPGNVKAIPLYKKCGFFWEKRENTTHLVNLMPDVLACDLINDYFIRADWYKDSTREIIQEPDSKLVNGFDLWQYQWEKDGKKLEVDYSRRGRGFRRIANDDLIIEVIVENMKLVFGDHYKVKYLFTNKTDKALRINIEGVNDKNIKFDFKDNFELVDYKEIQATFFVDEIEKKQKKYKTHPVVKSNISVNGKMAQFMTGIEPVFPLELKLSSKNSLNKLGVESDCYIDVENQCGSKASFEFEIENCENFSLSSNKYKVTLENEEKASIKSSFILDEAMVYNKKIKIKTIRDGKADFEFDKVLSTVLQADYGKLSGESEEFYSMANGQFRVDLLKENNAIVVKQVKSNSEYAILAPKLGKPFTQEFEKKKTSKVAFSQNNDWIMLTASYESDEIKGVSFKRILKLHSNGIFKRWFELKNDSGLDKEINISESMYFNADNMIAAYKKKFVSFENECSSEASYLDSSKLDENWLYSSDENCTYGFIWPKEYKMNIASNAFIVENDLKTVKTGQVNRTQEILIGASSFVDWHDVREFALGKTLDREDLVLTSEFDVNGGNPFVNETFDITFREHKTTDTQAEINIKVNHNLYSDKFSVNADNKESKLLVKLNEEKAIIELESFLAVDFLARKKAVYKKSDREVKSQIIKKEGRDVYQIDNGVLKFECAPDFSASLCSLKHKDIEWLTSSFPKVKQFSWWKAWAGGMMILPSNVDLQVLDEEDSSCELVLKKDSFGNEWTGLEITTHVKKNKNLKGIQWKQYYLTLPGIGVIARFVEFKNHNNEYSFNSKLSEQTFLDLPEGSGNAEFNYQDNKARDQKILSGAHDRDYLCDSTFEYRKKSCHDFMTMYSNAKVSSSGFFTGVGMAGIWGQEYLSTEAKASKVSTPKFIIFGDETLKSDWLRDFNKIKFNL